MRLSELLMMVRPEDKSEDIIIKMLKATFSRVDVLESQISEYQQMMDEYDAVLSTIRKNTRVRYSDAYHANVIDIDGFYPKDEGYDLVKKYLISDEEEKDEG